jgi:hypothetical protein
MDQIQKAQSTTSHVKKKRTGAHLRQWRWPKGVSGNPGGKPKKLRITRLFEKILNRGKNRLELEHVILDILKGRRMASVLLLREMAERTEGKVTQPVDVDAEGLAGLAEAIAKARKRKDDDDPEKS